MVVAAALELASFLVGDHASAVGWGEDGCHGGGWDGGGSR